MPDRDRNTLSAPIEGDASSSESVASATTQAPLFSIILTACNSPQLLLDALRSISVQHCRDFEVILVNDHGQAVEDQLLDLDFTLTYLRHGQNRGHAAARNAALNLARGRYLVYLDDDDLFLPDHLSTLALALSKHPESVVYTDAVFILERFEAGNRIEVRREKRHAHGDYSRAKLAVDNFIPVNTFAWPRALAASVGGFDEDLSGLEDWDFLLRLATQAHFHHVRQETVEIHVRVDNSESRTKNARRDSPALYQTIYDRNPETDPSILSARSKLLDNLGISRARSIDEWLNARGYSSAQLDRFAGELKTSKATTRLGILLLDLAGDHGALQKTLDSLEQIRPYVSFEIAVVSRIPASSPHEFIRLWTSWKMLSAQAHLADLLNDAVTELQCDWYQLVTAGEQLVLAGALSMGMAISEAPHELRALYADEVMYGTDGKLSALLRPDFNLDLLLSMPAGMSRHWLFRHDTLLGAGGFDSNSGEALELDLLLRLIDAGGIDGFGHLPEPMLALPPQRIQTLGDEQRAILRHLQQRGYPHATVEAPRLGCYRINYGHQTTPGVSIIIPTRDQFSLVGQCVESLLEKTRYSNYEVLIVDNGSMEADACTWLDGIASLSNPQLRVIRCQDLSSYAAMVNLAAEQARGEYLLLLGNDTMILQEDWLDAMLNHAQRPEVGIVGAKLVKPDGRLQHAGLLLGLHGAANTPFAGESLEAPGYMHRLQVDQNYSAVSDSCLLVRRSIFLEVGGLDNAGLHNHYSDIDFCLRVKQAGYLIVWTPHAILMQEGDMTHVRFGTASIEIKARHILDAQDALHARWLTELAEDPAHNRNFSLTGNGFEVETDGASTRSRSLFRSLPVTLALPADRNGCGHYRIIQPTLAMNEYAFAEAKLGRRYYSPVEMQRLCPDVVVFQRQMLREQLAPQQRMTRFSTCFKVAELDDYLPNVPLKSIHKKQVPSDILKVMRESLKQVDRFIVSTSALANSLSDMHSDIRVVENHLPIPWWGSLGAKRRQGKRPRVGWGGGSSHRGDLEMVADVVRTLANEVEWVFLGMCPAALRPFVHEFHTGVHIEDYPKKLASLDLDVAIAPLEENLFNHCKSNLRLLEFGACGFPVVCSDITPYQGNLPVTRVKPRFKDWVDAIRMHTHDLDAAAAAGDALRNAVYRDWMLDEKHAAFWLSQWLPD